MKIKCRTKISRKIPAFTLMEVTISMLIAAIAIAVTYTAYRIVSGTYQDYTRKQDKVAMFVLADRLLKKDFLQANRMNKNTDGLILELDGGQVRYVFAPDYILRDQFALRVDTFKLSVQGFQLSFEGREVAEGETVDELAMQMGLEQEELPLIYKKIYSSQDLFD